MLNDELRKKLLNLTIFQVGWLICIFCGSFWALATTLCALIIHGVFFVTHQNEWKVIAGFSCLGIVVDSGLVYGNILQTDSHLIPLWLACLWVLLSLTLCHSLQWLHYKPLLAAMLAAIIGPCCYWAGSQFVEIEFFPTFTNLVTLSLVWMLIMPSGLILARHLSSYSQKLH